VPELQLLRADHARPVLAFELANRAYFAVSISDRGEDYFEHFAEHHKERLAEQASGEGAYFVLVNDDGAIIGRFNLLFDGSGTAVLGYRVAENVAGRGVATAGVRELVRLAAEDYGIRTLRAATSHANIASQRVLLKAGFVPIGPANPKDVGGKAGTSYQRDLTKRRDA
jgi:ribosomal-protein-alanine N-acetyltransferase